MSRYQFYSVAEAAKEIGRNRWFLYDQITRKRIAVHRIGGRIAISQRDLDDFVARSRISAVGEKKVRATA